MAKKTVLDIVQRILSDADGDNVNSISDTVESEQAAQVVQAVYERIIYEYDLEVVEKAIRLNATSSATPTIMGRPEGLHDVEWVRYDTRESASDDPRFTFIMYSPPSDFINRQAQLSPSATNVTTVALESLYELPVYNDRAPRYWTQLDGPDTLIFDGYNSALETNLQASKSLAYGDVDNTITLADATEPDLPKPLGYLLETEAVHDFFDLYKGGATQAQMRNLRRARVRVQRLRRITELDYAHKSPNYGR